MSPSNFTQILVQYENGETSVLDQGEQGGGGTDNAAVVGYHCNYHVGTGAIELDKGVVVSSYYDLLYPCSSSSSLSQDHLLDTIQQTVLTNLAEYFELLPSGAACIVPNTALPVWVIGLNSMPLDTKVVPNLECQTLKSNDVNMCCAVVHAPMTFWWSNGKYEAKDMISVLKQQFNSPQATVDVNNLQQDKNVTIQYVGAFLMDQGAEQGRDNLNSSNPQQQPASTTTTTTTTAASSSKPKLSAVGAVLVVALVIAVLMAVGLLVMAKKRRRSRRQKLQDGGEDGLAKNKAQDDHDEYDTQSEGPTLVELDVEHYHSSSNSYEAGMEHDDQNNLFLAASSSSTPKVTNTNATSPRTSSPGSTPPPMPMMKNSSSTLSQPPPQQQAAAAEQQIPHLHSWEDEMIYGLSNSGDDNNNNNNDYDNEYYNYDGAGNRGSTKNSSSYHAPSYTFDLANSMKLDVLGTYNRNHNNHNNNNNAIMPSSMAVVPPYPMMEETSDSEVDSWAQTDGTVGSLEDRLEEITAEI